MDSKECIGCNYYLAEGSNDSQECKKWVKNGTNFETCDSPDLISENCSMKKCPFIVKQTFSKRLL